MIQSICTLAKDKRSVVHGVLDNLREFEYSNGKRFTFDLCDDTGSIRCIGFNEAHAALFANLKSGKTYKVHNVLPSVSNGTTLDESLELKIYPNTRFDAMPDFTVTSTVSVSDIATSGAKMVSLEGVLATLEDVEESPSLKSGSPCRRARMQDPTGDVGVFFIDAAAACPLLVEGVVLKVVGKASKQGSIFVSIPPTVVSKDADTLKTWADENPLKRARHDLTVLSGLSQIRDADIGTRADFVCVVRSCSLPGVTSSGARRRVLNVVDKGMCSVDVSVFDSGADKEFSVGDVVKIRATVSPYNTRSLTCKAVDLMQEEDLQTWWSLHSTHTFEDFSVAQTD